MRPNPERLRDLREFPIVYVDDEPENLRIFELTFRREFTIFTATSGDEGLERTAALVGDLRDFAAPGGRELGPVDLARGLRTTLRLMGHTLMSADVQVYAEIPEGLPQIRGDVRALNQVFLNLLKNAAESFEGASGAIWVAARAEGSELVVEIRDDGPGVAPEVRDRLFEPFVSTKAGRGSGLGLSISRRIVEEHGGRLELSSERGGAGTRVVIRLPASESEMQRRDPPSASPALREDRGGDAA